ncbi:hypothetical protein ANN_23281 [Periplaneta americana]|uniref:Uncharacterized protein n=1 Tax=Periplaneta americana TaxID=6978 RepID=A0ABQ8SKQ9_PERAM|nr:hypothetical protein ANN_23281 [Periplaneta americana]
MRDPRCEAASHKPNYMRDSEWFLWLRGLRTSHLEAKTTRYLSCSSVLGELGVAPRMLHASVQKTKAVERLMHIIVECIGNGGWEVLPRSLYSADLESSHCHVLRPSNDNLKKRSTSKITSSSFWKCLPRNDFFIRAERKKSLGAISGEYGGWKHVDSPPPKKAKTQPSSGKVMLSVFWDIQGVVLTDYAQKGQTITGAYYRNLLTRLREAIKTKRPRGSFCFMTTPQLILHKTQSHTLLL